MFDAAQERVSLGQFVAASALTHWDTSRPSMSSVRGPRIWGRRPPKNELLRLDEELDLANAATPEFDVVAGHGDALMAVNGVDLTLHRVDVGDRSIVEILAPDERRKVARKRSPACCRRRPAAP